MVTDLSILGLQTVQALLDDMVAIEVLNELDNLALESVDDGIDLFASREEFDHLL